MHTIRKTSRLFFCAIILLFGPTPDIYAGEAQDLLSQAYSAYQQEQWTSAKSPLERAIKLYPNYAEAQHLLGLVLVQLNQPDSSD